jgi:hypothetical protein
MQGSPAPLLPATAASSGFFSTGTGVGAAGLRPFGSGGHHQLRFPPTAWLAASFLPNLGDGRLVWPVAVRGSLVRHGQWRPLVWGNIGREAEALSAVDEDLSLSRPVVTNVSWIVEAYAYAYASLFPNKKNEAYGSASVYQQKKKEKLWWKK